MTTGNVNLARRWFEEVWNQRRTDTIDELLTEEGVSHSKSGPVRGSREFNERGHAPFLSAFPDLRIERQGAVAQGEEVVVRWAVRATHLWDGLGLPATGRTVSFRGMTWIRFSGGKMVEGVGLLEPGRADPVAPGAQGGCGCPDQHVGYVRDRLSEYGFRSQTSK